MLWCSNFRLFIKSIILDRYGNLIEKFIFVSTPWKIIISIVNHHPTHHHPQSLHTPPTPPVISTQPTPALTIKTTTNFATHPPPIPPPPSTPTPPTPQSNTTTTPTPHHHPTPSQEPSNHPHREKVGP